MRNVPTFEAAIFDYDGLLVDTEDCWFRACQFVGSKYQVDIGEERRLELMRSHLSEYLIKTFGLPASYPEVRGDLYGEFERLAADAQLLPGAHELLDTFAGQRLPMAVGTGSDTEQVSQSLMRHGIREYFSVIVGQDQVARGKPEPDTYLRAAELLGATPGHCVVFEDQPKGIAAAKAAGMFCVAVPNKYLRDVNYESADLVIPTLGHAALTLAALPGRGGR